MYRIQAPRISRGRRFQYFCHGFLPHLSVVDDFFQFSFIFFIFCLASVLWIRVFFRPERTIQIQIRYHFVQEFLSMGLGSGWDWK